MGCGVGPAVAEGLDDFLLPVLEYRDNDRDFVRFPLNTPFSFGGSPGSSSSIAIERIGSCSWRAIGPQTAAAARSNWVNHHEQIIIIK